jgi:hypothetical protein
VGAGRDGDLRRISRLVGGHFSGVEPIEVAFSRCTLTGRRSRFILTETNVR